MQKIGILILFLVSYSPAIYSVGSKGMSAQPDYIDRLKTSPNVGQYTPIYTSSIEDNDYKDPKPKYQSQKNSVSGFPEEKSHEPYYFTDENE